MWFYKVVSTNKNIHILTPSQAMYGLEIMREVKESCRKEDNHDYKSNSVF